ncbi:MAG: TatD family hydrolase [Legionellaceae bacterium]|nr:TatD family hydrolase [Legionellaceae bacterium]
MFIDSHCHLNMLDLTDFNQDLQQVLEAAQQNQVSKFLCVSVELADHEILSAIAKQYPQVYFSVGIHPNGHHQPLEDAEILTRLAASYSQCIAIGETGLDYYREEQAAMLDVQRTSFRQHIHTAKELGKPLIIHTRHAAEDTLRIMREENAADIGGVMHCFAEDWEVAQKALDLNFYISFSGIVTFKNAKVLQEVAQKVPADRMLIETDSPYLAPVPFRGKQNHPALVKHVAEKLAELRGESLTTIAQQTTENFYRCFRLH